MTDAEKHAKVEITLMLIFKNAAKGAKDKTAQIALLRKANGNAKHFRDNANNVIGDFLMTNAKDNRHLSGEPDRQDFVGMYDDEIKAIKGDTQTLLNE